MRVDRQVGAGRTAAEAGEHRLDHLVERQALLGAELGREAHLGVDDAVGGEILRALVGDPFDRVAVLHHADGVGERLEVEHEVVALGAAVEPRREVVDVGGRQGVVAVLAGQLDHGLRPQPAVEVVVEQRLGRPRGAGRSRAHQATLPRRRSGSPPGAAASSTSG